jgi:hypothetical protein
MEIPWARKTDTASWDAAAGLTTEEYRAVKEALRGRGVEGSPAYGAWLRTELIKLALRKQHGELSSVAAAA